MVNFYNFQKLSLKLLALVLLLTLIYLYIYEKELRHLKERTYSIIKASSDFGNYAFSSGSLSYNEISSNKISNLVKTKTKCSNVSKSLSSI